MAEEKEKSTEDKINNLEKEKDNLVKKINASKKQVPADQASASAYGSQASDPLTGKEAGERKKQFTAKKNAELASINVNKERMKAIDVEIKQLKDTQIEKESGVTENKLNKKYNIMAKLTKEQILNMVESHEPARMSKRELIESISNRLLTEDMNDDLKRKLESGEHDYSEHI